MRFQTRLLIGFLAGGSLLLGVTVESLGQSRGSTSREPVLRGNPGRDAGGSCVYDKEGRVVFAPDGKHCPDATDHLSKERVGDAPVVAAYPPALQGELAKLLRDHDHIAEEIARLERAVESQDREVAREAVGKIRTEVTDHRAREEAFFEKMAPSRRTP